jgi:hypothetical protein
MREKSRPTEQIPVPRPLVLHRDVTTIPLDLNVPCLRYARLPAQIQGSCHQIPSSVSLASSKLPFATSILHSNINHPEPPS